MCIRDRINDKLKIIYGLINNINTVTIDKQSNLFKYPLNKTDNNITKYLSLIHI